MKYKYINWFINTLKSYKAIKNIATLLENVLNVYQSKFYKKRYDDFQKIFNNLINEINKNNNEELLSSKELIEKNKIHIKFNPYKFSEIEKSILEKSECIYLDERCIILNEPSTLLIELIRFDFFEDINNINLYKDISSIIGKENMLTSNHVYLYGYKFYKDNVYTYTFSKTSGLINPIERWGAKEFVSRYGLIKCSPQELSPKNLFRDVNFKLGILNSEIGSRRVYCWERVGTSLALRDAYEKAEDKYKFINDARKLLVQALKFPNIKIVEIDQFNSFMNRFTRIGMNELMISIRGKESKKISHALRFDYTRIDDKLLIYLKNLIQSYIIKAKVIKDFGPTKNAEKKAEKLIDDYLNYPLSREIL